MKLPEGDTVIATIPKGVLLTPGITNEICAEFEKLGRKLTASETLAIITRNKKSSTVSDAAPDCC